MSKIGEKVSTTIQKIRENGAKGLATFGNGIARRMKELDARNQKSYEREMVINSVYWTDAYLKLQDTLQTGKQMVGGVTRTARKGKELAVATIEPVKGLKENSR